MLKEKEVRKISKFVSFVLRHQPEVIGLTLDANGWADVEELIAGANAAGRALSRDVLEEVVARNDKKRFVVSDDGARIRAAQGHSVDVDLQLEPREPPEILYHGTADVRVESILAHGLHAGTRLHVHLSPDEETATKVGRRHGRPAVLRVRTGDMWRDGHVFHLSDNGVWLTSEVPPQFIETPRDAR